MIGPDATPIDIVMAKTEQFIESNEMLNTNVFNAANNDTDVFVESFWMWKKFSHYVMATGVLLIILAIMTFFGQDNKSFIYIIGLTSSFIEA